MPTPNGSKADHRLPLRAADMRSSPARLTTAVGTAGRGPKEGENHDVYKWVARLQGLLRHKSAGLVIAGEAIQPPAGSRPGARHERQPRNVGKTVFYTDPIEAEPVRSGGLP